MDPEEGADSLLRRAEIAKPATTDREVALEITKAVDSLPLTLDQAGAYIEEMPSTLEEYLKLYAPGARRSVRAAERLRIILR